jgi:hypothetical protein
MSPYAWIAIILAVALLLWFMYSKYRQSIYVMQSNTYPTDIQGLVGSFESAIDNGGEFVSRLGSFFGGTKV